MMALAMKNTILKTHRIKEGEQKWSCIQIMAFRITCPHQFVPRLELVLVPAEPHRRSRSNLISGGLDHVNRYLGDAIHFAIGLFVIHYPLVQPTVPSGFNTFCSCYFAFDTLVALYWISPWQTLFVAPPTPSRTFRSTLP
jgi:hypothetical protein